MHLTQTKLENEITRFNYNTIKNDIIAIQDWKEKYNINE